MFGAKQVRMEKTIKSTRQKKSCRGAMLSLAVLLFSLRSFQPVITGKKPKTQVGEETLRNYLGVSILITPHAIEKTLRMRFQDSFSNL